MPRDVSKAIREAVGGKALHIPVRGWIEGLAMQSTLMPAGGGRYRLHVHSRIWRKLRIDAGAAVEVALQLETRGPDHCDDVLSRLRAAGYPLVFH